MQAMLTAITRAVGEELNACELSRLERRRIDVEKAARQHRNYEQCLADLGASVISLPAEPGLPDAVFVEDPAIVLDEVAVITRMGAASRRREAESLAAALSQYRPLHRIGSPGTLEGGDVMRVGRQLFVGVSDRTNPEGVRQLDVAVRPFGYEVQPVPVSGCMHLKTGCCYLGDGAILANRSWVTTDLVAGIRVLDVAPAEPWAANVLAIGGRILMPDSFPETRAILGRAGFDVRTVDISELLKAEAGATCMSLVFES
jgi:dimethylargininase